MFSGHSAALWSRGGTAPLPKNGDHKPESSPGLTSFRLKMDLHEPGSSPGPPQGVPGGGSLPGPGCPEPWVTGHPWGTPCVGTQASPRPSTAAFLRLKTEIHRPGSSPGPPQGVPGDQVTSPATRYQATSGGSPSGGPGPSSSTSAFLRLKTEIHKPESSLEDQGLWPPQRGDQGLWPP